MSRPSVKTIKKEEFLIGAGHSLSNSFDLFDDGAILKEKGRLSRAYTLFQLSMEEAGKVILLLDGFTMLSIHENNSGFFDKTRIDDYYKKLDNIFYDHSNKTKYIIEYELLNLNKFIERNNTNKEAGICKQRDEVQNDLKKAKNNK